MSQPPSVGRMVHYVSYGTPVQSDGSQVYRSECRAAVITALDAHPEDNEHGGVYVDLAVLNPTGFFFNQTVRLDEGDPPRLAELGLCDGRSHAGGTWHWPGRVGSDLAVEHVGGGETRVAGRGEPEDDRDPVRDPAQLGLAEEEIEHG